MQEYFKLLKFIRPYRLRFVFSGLLMVCSSLFEGVQIGMVIPLADRILNNKPIVLPSKLPRFLEEVVMRLNSIPPMELLKLMTLFVPALFLLKGVFGYLQGYLISDIGQLAVRDIRAKLYGKFHSLSLDYFTHKRGGELIARIVNDAKLVENALSYGLTDLITQSLNVVVFTATAFLIYSKMALIAFLLLPLMSYPIVRVGKVLRKLSKRSQESMADINSVLYETILGMRVIKAFNMENYEIGKFGGSNRDTYKLSMKSIKRTLMLGQVTEFLGVVGGIVIFNILARDVINGKLSFGTFVAFFMALMQMIRPFKKLSQVNSIFQQALAANSRIYEVLDTQPSVKEGPAAKQISGLSQGIKLDNVEFAYGENAVIKGVTLNIKQGEVLAIVGPSGSGKSTLVDLISRFYDPVKGRILIDNNDIRDLSISSLRSIIGIVTQETILFNDTIKANISYGRNDVSAREIEQAAMKAHAHDFIMKLPKGYDTVIGDRGMTLSGGERQRIAIARALLKNPPILILDEATSQLDTESERIVQDALNELMKGRTVFVIAHRLSTIRNASRIIVLNEGKVAESGSHQELLGLGGLYERLCHNQGI